MVVKKMDHFLKYLQMKKNVTTRLNLAEAVKCGFNTSPSGHIGGVADVLASILLK